MTRDREATGDEGRGAELIEARDGAIVTLTMSNPGKLNAMSLEIARRVEQHVRPAQRR